MFLPALELTCLAVDWRYQRQGIGTWLLRGLIDRIAELWDDYPVDLLVLVALSEKSRSWYLSRGLGFQTAPAPPDRITQFLPVNEMRRLRAADPLWPEKRETLPPFPWPRGTSNCRTRPARTQVAERLDTPWPPSPPGRVDKAAQVGL